MPDEVEIETSELQETVEEFREEREARALEERETAWVRWISLSTALLAVVAAVAALQSGTLSNEALVEANEAVLSQAQASDQWAYYQAKGIKQNVAAEAADLAATNPALAARYRSEARRYRQQQNDISATARDLERQRGDKLMRSGKLLDAHHVFAYCVTFTQVAIALSAIAALTKRKPVWYGSLLIGVVGLALFINGYVLRPAAAPERPAQGGSEARASGGRAVAAPARTAPRHRRP